MSLNATVLLPDGSDSVMPLAYADEYLNAQLQVAVIFGVRMGAAIVLSAILWMVARTYRSILFVLYQLNFTLMLIHAALSMQNLESSTWSMTWYFTGIADTSTTTINCSMTASILYWFLIISICLTFIVQIQAAFADLPRAKHIMVMVAAIVAAFPCVFVWGYYLITNARIANMTNDTDSLNSDRAQQTIDKAQWSIDGAWPVFAATTTLFSAVLCIKLYKVVRARARLGIEHFDPLKALLVMTFQNSVIPAIFSIICASLPDQGAANGLPSIAILLTVVLLPVGYIWAQYRSVVSPAGSKGHTSTLASYVSRSRSSRASDNESEFGDMPSPTTATSASSTRKVIDFVYSKAHM